MTPLLIEILFHYHCRATDYRDADFSAPAVREGIDWLRDEAKLIDHNDPKMTRRNMYHLTERGLVYIEALQAVPLPVQTWVMPTGVGSAQAGGGGNG